ncbi:MAG: HAD family hydrolase [Ilumatobacteraceae bacterium]
MSSSLVIGLDADDTLWRSEDHFRRAEELFLEWVGPHTPDGIDLAGALRSVELGNIALSGYGVKAFGLSMIEAAVTATQGAVPSQVLGDLVDHVHDLLREPVELLPHIPEVLADLGRHHRLVLITKGDLVHQTRKVGTSGLEHHFDRVGVVLEKDRETYRRLLADWTIDASQFVMVGNSVPSDVLPVLALGGRAVHIPYHVTWEHETVDASGHDFPTLDSILDLPGLIATWGT